MHALPHPQIAIAARCGLHVPIPSGALLLVENRAFHTFLYMICQHANGFYLPFAYWPICRSPREPEQSPSANENGPVNGAIDRDECV